MVYILTLSDMTSSVTIDKKLCMNCQVSWVLFDFLYVLKNSQLAEYAI